MPTPETALRKLDLTPDERREVESEIWRLKKSASIPVGMRQAISVSPLFSLVGRWSLKNTISITKET